MLYFDYKGISEGKYVDGEVQALNQEEAAFKLKNDKIIITKLIKSKKKATVEIKKKQVSILVQRQVCLQRK